MRYYVKDDGAVRGPWVWVEIRARMRSGKISDRALVKDENTSDWYDIAVLSDDRRRHDEARSKHELGDALADARRRARGHLLTGGTMIVVGVGASLASLALAGVTGGGLLFVGLILAGAVQVGRGLKIRP